LIRIHLALDSVMENQRIKKMLLQPHVLVFTSDSGSELLTLLERENCALVILSYQMVLKSEFTVIEAIRKLPDQPEIVVVSPHEDAIERSNLLSLGCFAVLCSQIPDDILQKTLDSLIQRKQRGELKYYQAKQQKKVYFLSDFQSTSGLMNEFLKTVRRIISVDSSLLILGETGVGKERLARSIHCESHRSEGPFIAVNCAALPETLLESELFGHIQGAFTGATQSHRGYFELAHRGTLFLDEIGELSPHLQVKLLRVLQDHVIQRVGSETIIEVDVRIIAATNRNIQQAIENQQFRRDLYYRLGVVTLEIPPLRERREDIPGLVQTFLETYQVKFGREVIHIQPEAHEAMLDYSWPGNIRELINVIERAVLLCNNQTITMADLPQAIHDEYRKDRSQNVAADIPIRCDEVFPRWYDHSWAEVRKNMLKAMEKQYLRELLKMNKGRIGETARKAGLNPRSLYQKMHIHGLSKEDFKDK